LGGGQIVKVMIRDNDIVGEMKNSQPDASQPTIPFDTVAAPASDPKLIEELQTAGVAYSFQRPPSPVGGFLLSYLLPLALLGGFWYLAYQRAGGAGGGMGSIFGVGKSKAIEVKPEEVGVTFKDVGGERNPQVLAAFRQPACKADEATVIKALTGTWQAEQLFVLQQSLTVYDTYTAQLAACDAEIARQFSAVKPHWDAPVELPTLPTVKPGSKSKNKPAAATRQELFRIVGVDLVAVEGISASLAQIILSEIGTDMSRFPTVKHFCSWLGLAPHNDISGGRVLRSRTLKTDNRAGQAFRQAAASVSRSDSAFGAFYRRKRAQLGPMQALVATAHKIARAVYFMLKEHRPYRDMGAEAYETQQRERELACLKRKAAQLGFDLTAKPAPSAATAI
jgi:hypothetical protein